MPRMDRLGKLATTVATVDGQTIVTYHSTAVVRFTADTVTLDSGHWRTATTKTRMNQASRQFDLGYSVNQKNGGWSVTIRNGAVLPFSDGMTFPR